MEPTAVTLVLDDAGADPEYLEEQLQLLIAALGEGDVGHIERVPGPPPPEGTRAGTGVELGALLIGLGGAGATLPVLLGLVRDWLGRRGSGTIRVKIGEDELELGNASRAVQQRVLDDFLRRHEG
ncbi:hypothetical protein [Phytomonospora endophytica]|uniref:Uncharacterized protein n=1 Tax=Phytomonospora endophytica TaxID=714109 RepID=A0A841FTZ9_9ACTN|nr:hypothetical protein [Phytomonospora endophytica]MBB6039264.1 hypothetical protein [Phytomonospora endophytica]GIG69794.1 hypothetical protein Pen01_60890 [Phytomonospora endophytica]